jgi:hypothetical protein
MKENIKTEADYTDWMVKTGGYAKDMTLRDHFAGVAMQAFIRLHEEALTEDGEPCSWYEDGASCEVVSEQAYAVAGEMLKERNK